MNDPKQPNRKAPRHNMVGLLLAGVVAGMVGLSFAAVPLYRVFCQATAYDGTPRRAVSAPGPAQVLDRTIRIRFDGSVAPGLPWSFEPVQQTMDVKIGETALAFFKAVNKANTPVTGHAVFNVSPEQAGLYFTKIQCFCFTEQTLQPGASAEMPVTFFVDPKIVDDDEAKDIPEITLSYTFYRSDTPPAVAVAPRDDKSGS